jgi:tetratricopeptide (TPR) repeat protein
MSRWRVLLLALGLASASLGACRAKQVEDCEPSEQVVDPVLLAFLSQARSAHHSADQREAQGDLAAALEVLQGLTRAGRPPGGAPEVGEVLADTQARIADLLSRSQSFDEADRALEAGLEQARSPSYFRGHLFEVRGLVEERREKALRAKERGPEADQARERSLAAYEEAMKIQAEVIQKASPPALR